MHIFAEQKLSELLGKLNEQREKTVQNESPNYLLNVNELDYVGHLVSRFSIDPLEIHFDQCEIISGEQMIEAERFPGNFHVFAGRRYPRQVITYLIPFTGDARLLRCRPNTYTMSAPVVRVEENRICFDVVNFSDDTESIKRSAESTMNSVKRQYEHLISEVRHYNSHLETETRALVQKRKAEILKQSNFLHSLGVPVRRSDNVPETFAVPAVQKKVIIKPMASDKAFAPEPTLENSAYEEILQVINEIGEQIEKHPDIHRDRDEEGLRDVFLVTLVPNFQSASGETFNKVGKTDILIRHQANNIFVAECKIWKGAKNFSKAIDQLLSYLTWRDSKSALICFVRNKEFSSVLDEIERTTKIHPQCLRLVKRGETAMRFEFRLPDDPNRNLHLAVLCFHFS